MDPSDWLQGSIHDDFSGMDSSSPLSGDMLTCARPLIERRLRPPHDLDLKCPRCESTHTKFCYYNNYSLTQPRYFCKTCRRYWTKGGTLRNIPVGGGCRKNKKVSSSSNSGGKKSSEANSTPQVPLVLNRNHSLGSSSTSTQNINPTDLSFNIPDHDHQVQFPPLHHFGINPNPNFWMGNNNVDMLENPSRIDYDFMGSGNMGLMNGLGEQIGSHNFPPKFHISCSSSSSPSPHEMCLDGNNSINGGNIFMDTCNRLMIPYNNNIEGSMEDQQNALMMDVKPSTKLLSLEWHEQNDHDHDHHDQGCSMVTNHGGKDNHHHPSFGYLNVNGLGSWNNGMINGYGPPSTTNPLV